MNLFELFVKIGVDDQASGKLKDIGSKLGNGLQTAAKVGMAAVTAVGSGIAAIGTYAAKVGGDFEAQMSKVSAISGATGDDLQALEDKAKQLGIDTKFSATEAGQAFEYMAMAGWKTEQMLNGVAGIMDLAAASGEDLASVSDIVTDAMTAFGLSAEQSTHFADVLAQASSNANTNVALLGESFKYVAPVAGALGYSVEDTATALGLMANAGIKGSQAGTALRSALSSMLSASDTVYGAMMRLGLATEDTVTALVNEDGTSKSLAETMGILRDAFSELTEAEQAEYAANIFGREAMSGMLAIINTSDEEFEKLTNSIYSADGAAQRMAKTMANNLKGQLTLLKSSAEGFGLAVYEKIQAPLTEMASWAVEALNTLTEAFGSGGIEGLVEAAGGVLSEMISSMVDKLPEFVNLAVSILNSLVFGITDNLDVITNGAVNAITSFAEGMISFFPNLIELGASIIESLLEGLSGNIGVIADGVVDIISFFITEAIKLLPKVAEIGLDLIVSLADGILSNIDEIITTAISVISALVETISNPQTLEKVLDAALRVVVELGNGLINAVPQLVGVAVALIENLVDFILDRENIEKILKTALSLIQSLMDGLVDSIPLLVDAAIEIIMGLIDFILDADNIEMLLDMAFQIVSAVAEGLIKAIPQLLIGAVKLIASLVDKFKETDWQGVGESIVDGLWEGIKALWDDVVRWVEGAADDLVSGVKDVLGIASPSKRFSEIGNFMALGLGEGFENSFKKIKERIYDAMQFDNVSVGVSDITPESPDRAWGKTVSVIQNIYSEAKTAADLMMEALFYQERAVFMGV